MDLASACKQEKVKTKAWLEDVMRFLSHDTSNTRRQLAEVLRQRAELIEAESRTDFFFEKVLKEESPTCRECGYKMSRSGMCWKCENCGHTLGCD